MNYFKKEQSNNRNPYLTMKASLAFLLLILCMMIVPNTLAKFVEAVRGEDSKVRVAEFSVSVTGASIDGELVSETEINELAFYSVPSDKEYQFTVQSHSEVSVLCTVEAQSLENGKKVPEFTVANIQGTALEDNSFLLTANGEVEIIVTIYGDDDAASNPGQQPSIQEMNLAFIITQVD